MIRSPGIEPSRRHRGAIEPAIEDAIEECREWLEDRIEEYEDDLDDLRKESETANEERDQLQAKVDGLLALA